MNIDFVGFKISPTVGWQDLGMRVVQSCGEPIDEFYGALVQPDGGITLSFRSHRYFGDCCLTLKQDGTREFEVWKRCNGHDMVTKEFSGRSVNPQTVANARQALMVYMEGRECQEVRFSGTGDNRKLECFPTLIGDGLHYW